MCSYTLCGKPFSTQLPHMKNFALVYLAVCALEIFAEATGNTTLGYITKPLLMVALIAWYARGVNGNWNSTHKMMVAAFAFSWVGDVTLMLVHINENLFLVGLASFLVTHILYTVSFAHVTDKQATALFPKKFWVTTPLLVYLVVFLSALLPAIYNDAHTRPVLIPVILYTTAIGTMVAFSINRYKRVNDQSFTLVFLGALLFMVSDSIIAYNRFISPFGMAGILIMTLYLGGQFLIAKGVLQQYSKTKN